MAAETLPGSPTSPYDVIKSKYKDVKYLLGRQFAQDSRALQSQLLSDADYNQKTVELNAHYNKLLQEQTFGHRTRIKELDRIKGSVGRGEMTDQAGYQAGWKMVLPSETYQARFPALSGGQGAQARPISASGLKSAAGMMSAFIGASKEKRGFEWGKPKRTQDSMVEQYMDWRAQSGYDQLDPLHQRQLDLRWDALMKSDKVYRDWFSDKEKTKPIASVASLRMKGKLGKAMSKKFVPRQYGSGRPGSVTPIGSSFIKDLDKRSRKHLPDTVEAPTAAELQGEGTKEAYDKGVKLGYWK
jgi:hypothetical protein